MTRPRGRVRRIGILSIGFAMLVVLSGLVAADSHVWTTQADFASGTLVGVDATSSPGSLTLGKNVTEFAPYSGNPVLTPDPSGWDSTGVIPYSVLQVAGTWVMWYTGFNGSGTGIGRASSADGIHWTRSPSTPIITTADWPVVLYEAGTYKMWYEHPFGPYQPTEVDYATSADGIHWTPFAGNPVLSPAPSGFDALIVTPGGVVHDGSGYRMWYTGNDGSSLTYSVGLATSPDGVNWTRYGGNPVITPPFGGSWDSERVISCLVIPWNGALLMGYIGADSSFIQRIALATSVDGIHWTPFPSPTLDLGPSGSWDGYSLTRFAVYASGSNLTMLFGGSPSQGYYETGLAKAPSYAPVGTFASAVFDSGNSNTTWSSLAWTGSTSTNTSIGVSLQVGNSSTPDLTWAFSAPSVNTTVSLNLPKARYARVLVALVSLDPSQTPRLDSLTLVYTVPAPLTVGGLDIGFVLLLVLGVGIVAAVGLILFFALRSKAPYPPPATPTPATLCASCGSPVPAGNPFCGHCGNPVNPPGGSVPPRT